jgi:cell division septation protein DedD
MTTSDCATDIALPASQSEDSQNQAAEQAPQRASGGASKPLKGLLWGFGVTVTVGLTLASWYVGVRIVAADEVAPASATTGQTAQPTAAVQTAGSLPSTAPVQSAASLQSAAPAQSAATEHSIAESSWYTVPPADLYLQVAGIGPKQDESFVRSLQAKGFGVHLQGGDRADDARILIGPFSTHAAMEQAQRKLQSAGVLAVETDAPAPH